MAAFDVLKNGGDDPASALDSAYPEIDRLGPGETWRGSIGAFTPSEVIDLFSISESENLTAVQVLEERAREQSFDSVVDDIRKTTPERFVAAELTEDRAVVHVTGDATGFANSRNGRGAISVEFVGGHKYPETELLRKHRDLVNTLASVPNSTLTSSLDPSSESVSLVTSNPSAVTRRLAGSTHSAVDGRKTSDVIFAGLTVDVRQAPETRREKFDAGTIRGGAHLEGCTSGFVLRSQYSGAKRLATAAHCGQKGEEFKYQNRNQADYTFVEMLFRHLGENGDIAYTDLGVFDSYPSFYAGVSEIRAVRETTNSFYEGRTLCRFGKTTHNQCSKSNGRFTSREEDNVTMHNLVEMDGRHADGGDSGGPWYAPHQNSAAAGIHSGGTGCFPRSFVCDVFTPVSAYDQYAFSVWTL